MGAFCHFYRNKDTLNIGVFYNNLLKLRSSASDFLSSFEQVLT
jgi:hypothetical protein